MLSQHVFDGGQSSHVVQANLCFSSDDGRVDALIVDWVDGGCVRMDACAVCERVFTDNGVVDWYRYLGESTHQGIKFREECQVPRWVFVEVCMEGVEELCEVDDAGSFTDSEDAGVDDVCSSAVAVDGVDERESSVIMAVDCDLGCLSVFFETVFKSSDVVVHVVCCAGNHVTSGVCDTDDVCSGFDSGLCRGNDVFKIGSYGVFGCVSDDEVWFLCSSVLDGFCDVFYSVGEWLLVDFLESPIGDAVENA